MTQSAPDAESRVALQELLETLREIDEHYVGPGGEADDPGAVEAGHRFLLHLLGGGLDLVLEDDPAYPEFRPTLQAGRKFRRLLG